MNIIDKVFVEGKILKDITCMKYKSKNPPN